MNETIPICHFGTGRNKMLYVISEAELANIKNIANKTTAKLTADKSFPTRENAALTELVKLTGGAGVPLVVKHVDAISASGGLMVQFDLLKAAWPTGINDHALTNALDTICDTVAKNNKYWQKDKNRKFRYLTKTTIPLLKGSCHLTVQDASKVTIPVAVAKCPIKGKCVAYMIDEAEIQDKKARRELHSDARGGLSAVVDAIWQANTGDMPEIPGNKVFVGVMKGADIMFVSGKIMLRLRDGDNEVQVYIEEISGLVSGWAVAFAGALAGSATSKGNPYYTAGGAFLASISYAFSGSDEIVAKKSFRAYLELKITYALTKANFKMIGKLIRYHMSGKSLMDALIKKYESR